VRVLLQINFWPQLTNLRRQTSPGYWIRCWMNLRVQNLGIYSFYGEYEDISYELHIQQNHAEQTYSCLRAPVLLSSGLLLLVYCPPP
jgi:hypothetical protein